MNGLFVGLTTLDLIYLTSELPKTNQKIVALDQTIAAGGPATNAAVTFSYLKNQATVAGILGKHPLNQLILSDLDTYSVNFADLEPHRIESPAVSSIFVLEETGERSVISVNARQTQATPKQLPHDILQGIDLVLIDGHQMAVSYAIASQAKIAGIPVVVDGGSWKNGFETILPLADYVICSANFFPPQCRTQTDVFQYLSSLSIPFIAITQGNQPILYQIEEKLEQININPIQAVDTLGAGDIFHGAFCYYILKQNFVEALLSASKIATKSCLSFGTRQWMQLKETED
ncbi:sugar kinase [Chroococcus sp. FPU101]|uniref:sugar kinase n=1 Tax=Chroococcus sp. FPU101 TaxID=1974212 RepID=UPI001A90031B|nr:sugar kinase [Chroococcus sp. FPU101]GFE71507.1 ribokinase-like domain-containing protein [Chroococcus sp. FPU101]